MAPRLPVLPPNRRSNREIPTVTVNAWPGFSSNEPVPELDDWDSPRRNLRGIWGAMDVPQMPPSMSTVYGKRDLPLRLTDLKVDRSELAKLNRTLSPKTEPKPELGARSTKSMSQTAPASWRSWQSAKKPKRKLQREPSWQQLVPTAGLAPLPEPTPEPKHGLPIAPCSNKMFFARSAKMCIRIVQLKDTKVKLRISGTKGSVLAEPVGRVGQAKCSCRSSWLCRCKAQGSKGKERKEVPSSPYHVLSTDRLLTEPDALPTAPGYTSHTASLPLALPSSADNSPTPSVVLTRSETERKRSGSFRDGKICDNCGQLFSSDVPDVCRNCGHKRQSSAEMREEMILNAKEDVRVSVFNKLQDHNEVHRDELPKGLELCGFVGIRQSWVDSACDGITKYSTLELEEFLNFVKGYEARQDNFYKSTFEEADLDNSGTMEAGELAEMLQKLGIEPMSHVLDEVIREVDDGNGELEFKEFKHLMDLLVVREGFTSSEYDSYVELFNNLDPKKTGEISDEDIRTILKWLTCSLPDAVLQEILNETDADGSGTISQREYLRSLRKIREHELELVRQALGDQEQLPKEQVTHLFRDLGYILWDALAIAEAAEEAKIQENQLDLSNLWRLLLMYRQREGMRNSELDSIDAAFRKEDLEGTGELTALEVPTAIRSLGYQVSFEAMQSVLRQVDVNDSGSVDQMQFRKVVRMLQECDAQLFLQAFDDEDPGQLQAIPLPSAIQAFCTTGLQSQSLDLPEFNDDGMLVRRDDFVRSCAAHAHQVREAIKRNGGWTDPEVNYLKLFFQKYDLDKNGRINKKELVQLVEDVVPEMAHERSMRPQLLSLMRSVDEESNGLNLEDFLKLMGLFRSFKDKERLRKEQWAIRDAGFHPQEVADFRELFLNSLDNSQDMSYPTFSHMISGITPLGKSLSQELEKMFHETCAPRHEADFPDFLVLMKTLLDKDFGNLREKSKKRLAKGRR